MSKCWLLFKVQLLGFFGINRALKTNDKREPPLSEMRQGGEPNQQGEAPIGHTTLHV